MNIGRLFVATVLLAGPGATEAAIYTVTDLGVLGGSESEAYGINASGQVVGRAFTTGNAAYAPTLFGNPNLDLGSFGGALVNQASGINSLGVIVGTNTLPGNMSTRAFVSVGKTQIGLGTLGGTSSTAFAINDNGQITGGAQTGGAALHAYRYQGGTMTDLGGTNATGYGINSAGIVVGQSNFKAFIAPAGAVVDIGTLGTGTESAAYGISDSNQIVGWSNTTNGGKAHPFRYEGGMMIDLGLLGNGDLGHAWAVNNSNQIVGDSNTTANSPTQNAFTWQAGQMTNLNDLIPANSGWFLSSARAINDSGQIAGLGTHNGVNRAFLLTPTSLTNNVIASQSPRIYVNGARRILTTQAKSKLSGSSGGSVSEVRYRLNGKGAYKPTRGQVSGWKITIRLNPGKNLVQFIAVSPTGAKSRPAKVVIIRKD